MNEEDLAALLNEQNAPFAKLMGVVVTRASRERIEAEFKVRPEHCTIPAVLHGGAIMAFADNLGGIGAYLNLPEGASTTTIESKTNFLRAVPAGDTAKAVTTPIKTGRTVQVWKTEVFTGAGELAAIVTQSQLVLAGDRS